MWCVFMGKMNLRKKDEKIIFLCKIFLFAVGFIAAICIGVNIITHS